MEMDVQSAFVQRNTTKKKDKKEKPCTIDIPRIHVKEQGKLESAADHFLSDQCIQFNWGLLPTAYHSTRAAGAIASEAL